MNIAKSDAYQQHLDTVYMWSAFVLIVVNRYAFKIMKSSPYGERSRMTGYSWID